MSDVLDRRTLGDWPLQDHRKGVDPALRNVPRGARVVDLDVFGRKIVAGYGTDEGGEKAYGDLQGAGFVGAQGGQRLCGSFWFACPVEVVDPDVTSNKPPGGLTKGASAGPTPFGQTYERGAPVAPPEAIYVQPLRDVGGVDRAYGPVRVELPEDAPVPAAGTRGVLLFGSAEDRQAPIFLPADAGIVSDHVTGALSSKVFPVTLDGERVDHAQGTGLDRFVRVVRAPVVEANRLAWSWPGDVGAPTGGLVYQHGAYALLEGVIRIRPDAHDPAHAVAHLGIADGPAYLAHLRPSAPWYQGAELDGPHAHGKPPYGAGPGTGSGRQEVSLLFDRAAQTWRWETSTLEDYPRDDPPPDPEPPGGTRVRTGVRTGGGGGGRGWLFDPESPYPTGYNEEAVRAAAARAAAAAAGGGREPRRPPARDPRARGGGGAPDSDRPEDSERRRRTRDRDRAERTAREARARRNASDSGDPSAPKPTGSKINKTRLRNLIALGDSPRRRERPAGALARGSGVALDDLRPVPDERDVAWLVSEGVLDHQGAVRGPWGTRRVGDSPGTAALKDGGRDLQPRLPAHVVLAAGLSIAGEETATQLPTAARGGPLSAAARKHVMQAASPVATIHGLYQTGDGSARGGGNKPGARAADGALVVLPPDLTLRDALAGTEVPNGLRARIVLPHGTSEVLFARPSEAAGGGASGQLVTSTTTGIRLENVDSDGDVVAGQSALYGEGGVVVTGNVHVTGKLTVDGSLDPLNLQVTDLVGSPSEIDLGDVGVEFDSTEDADRPLWTEPGGARAPLALLSDAGVAGGGASVRAFPSRDDGATGSTVQFSYGPAGLVWWAVRPTTASLATELDAGRHASAIRMQKVNAVDAAWLSLLLFCRIPDGFTAWGTNGARIKTKVFSNASGATIKLLLYVYDGDSVTLTSAASRSTTGTDANYVWLQITKAALDAGGNHQAGDVVRIGVVVENDTTDAVTTDVRLGQIELDFA